MSFGDLSRVATNMASTAFYRFYPGPETDPDTGGGEETGASWVSGSFNGIGAYRRLGSGNGFFELRMKPARLLDRWLGVYVYCRPHIPMRE